MRINEIEQELNEIDYINTIPDEELNVKTQSIVHDIINMPYTDNAYYISIGNVNGNKIYRLRSKFSFLYFIVDKEFNLPRHSEMVALFRLKDYVNHYRNKIDELSKIMQTTTALRRFKTPEELLGYLDELKQGKWLIGFLELSNLDEKYYEVDYTRVNPEYSGQGFMSKLYDAALLDLKGTKYKGILSGESQTAYGRIMWLKFLSRPEKYQVSIMNIRTGEVDKVENIYDPNTRNIKQGLEQFIYKPYSHDPSWQSKASIRLFCEIA